MNLTKYKSILEFNRQLSSDVGIIIGNFDGIHLGHRKLVKDFLNKCIKSSVTPVVITFNPHPHLFFKPEAENFLITSAEQKLSLLNELGLQHIIELPFNEELKSMSAEYFLEENLLNLKGLSLIYLGHDFSLGSGKTPAKNILKKLIEGKGIELEEADSFKLENKILSSTYIREIISEQPIEKVNKFLGYPYFLNDFVINGYGVGKKELVPTANIKIHKEQIYPQLGVYFTKTTIDGNLYHSITNIGVRPSLKDEGGLSIETNIFGFDDNLYDKKIKVEFLHFHRPEIAFSTKEELLEQIQKDINACKEFHA